jgi:DNA-binding NtrC family response regulator
MPGSSEKTRETILVVDGDETVRNLIVAILQQAKFNVLTARSGPDAVKLAAGTDGVIHLLLAEVDAPGMSGPDLGEALKKGRPDLRVMLMSASANGSLLVLNYGWAYIQKSVVPEKLLEMVRDVLYAPDRSQLGGHEFDSKKDNAQAAADLLAASAAAQKMAQNSGKK